MAPVRRVSFLLSVAAGACWALLAAGGVSASQLDKTPRPVGQPSGRSLSGLPSATVETPSPPPPPPPGSTPPSGSWLPQCTTVNVGSGYDLVASAAVPAPAASASFPSPLNGTALAAAEAEMKKQRALDALTGAEFLASIGHGPSFSPPPRPLPINNLAELNKNDTVTGAAVCANDVPYTQGPTASKTVCEFVNCYVYNGQKQCYICSGTFVGDPSGQGRTIFLTASHCAALSTSQPLTLSSSYVDCNRGGSDGIFRATGASVSTIDFDQGYGITDGAFILVSPASNTNVAYAAKLAIGAIKSSSFSTSVPNYSAGLPQVDSRLAACTAGALGNTQALHYSRKTSARTLVSTGIQIPGISGCGGNSGGPLVDESACVVYGVLSSTTVSCSGGTNYNSWSRLTSSSATAGVNVPALSSALVAGQVNFV